MICSLNTSLLVLAISDRDLISFDDEWCVDLNTHGTVITYKIDSGAQANILPLKDYKKIISPPALTTPRCKLSAYNGSDIPVKGSCTLDVQYKNVSIPVLFLVADINSAPIVGLKTSSELNLIKRVHDVKKLSSTFPDYIVNEFSDCFGEIGCFPNTHHIVTDPTVPPVVNPPRRLPISLHQKLHEELQRMIKLKIIVPVHEPTDWVNSLVCVEKPDGSLRLCLDPRDLNKAIKRPHYIHPTTEDILARMSKANRFTKLDASSAYWQILLDTDSSKLLTFNSPFGRYRFLRMAYGINSASDVCQYYISQIVEGIDGCVNSQDDIIIWGENEEELKNRTISVFKSIRSHGLKLNRNKCQFNKSEILFLGHKISSTGISPDEKKVEAIKNMPYPCNVKDLQRFLGSVNYLAKFIPNLSENTANLRKLLEKSSVWYFDDVHRREIDNLKSIITQAPVLKFYDPNLPLRISCDASAFGLGAVLEQKFDDDWYAIAYASRSLSSAEQNYCQLEKETLSIVFACSKFHDYIYGKKFHVLNDHKPLKSIFKRSLIKAPPRIQRFLLRLQKYEFEMEYIQGSKLTVADTLSRAPLNVEDPEISEEEMKFYVHSVVSKYLISDDKFILFQQETEKDDTLKLLSQYVKHGWPVDTKEIPFAVRPYYNYRDELTLLNGVLLKDNRIIVPHSLRQDMKLLLHTGHLGIIKMKGRARDTLFWPGISKELEDIVRNCEPCQQFQNKLQSELILPHHIPEIPWTKVGTDLFELNDKIYVIVVDYTSNFYDISQLPDKRSSTVVTHTKRIFSKFGIPKLVFSDNGPEFIGNPYKTFSKQWDFVHDTSSPNYPESNGQVERTIQLVKKTLRKAFLNNDDPYLALLAIRVCPGPYDNPPPATLFFGRPICSSIPSVKKAFQWRNKKLTRTMKNKHKVKNLSQLHKNDRVRLHDGRSWSLKGKIVDVLDKPRSYVVLTENGSRLRRNRKHILPDTTTYVDRNDDCSSELDFDHVITPEPDSILDLSNLLDDLNIDDTGVILPAQINNNDAQVNVTRSGRIILRPARLNDYV